MIGEGLAITIAAFALWCGVLIGYYWGMKSSETNRE